MTNFINLELKNTKSIIKTLDYDKSDSHEQHKKI